uniref:Uncharacterized protein n=1 Tax=Heterorhabditis bacteriophora TaxID=37862 RepID=A0A1I7XDP2_HETBA
MPQFFISASLIPRQHKPDQLSSGFKSPSKATHYEWLDTTRTTFRLGKKRPKIAPLASQMRGGEEAKRQMSRLIGALRQKPRLKKALKIRTITQYEIKMEPAGFDTSITTPYASPTTTRPRQHLMHPLFWMTIVEQLSLGRVCQEEGERNGVASWSRRGTDPALLPRFRMTYTTRPSQDLLDQ